jgi:hypothetical protein
MTHPAAPASSGVAVEDARLAFDAIGDVTKAPVRVPARRQPAPLHGHEASRCAGKQPCEPYRNCYHDR